MVDYLRRFNQHVGLMQRLREAIDAEKQGQVLGLQYGDIPVAGGLLHVPGAALNTVGLGLEAAGTAGKAIAGIAEIPAVYGQANFGSQDQPITPYMQQLADRGIGDLLSHPGRTSEALRNSPDTATSYLAGILEMVSDPTNVALGPASGYVKAGKAIRAGEVAAASAKTSGEFAAEKLAEQARNEKAFARFNEFINREGMRLEGVQRGKQQVAGLAEQLGNAQGAKAAAQAAKKEAPAVYKSAQAIKQEAARGAKGDFTEALADLDPELQASQGGFLDRYVEGAKNATVAESGVPRGVTYGQFKTTAEQAAGKTANEEGQIAELYRQAVQEAPKAPRYDLKGNPLGADKGKLPNIGDINTSFDSDPNLAGMVGVDDPQAPFDIEALAGLRPDSPKAIAAGVGRVANAEPMTREAVLDQFGVTEQGLASDITHGRIGEARAAIQQLPPYEQIPIAANNEPSISLDPTTPLLSRMNSMISTAFTLGKKAQREAMNQGGFRLGFRDIINAWKGINIQTMRNGVMDEGFNRAVLADAGIRKSVIDNNESWLVNRIKEMGPDEKGLYEHPLAHTGGVSDIMDAQGALPRLTKKEFEAEIKKFGVNPLEVEATNGRNLSAMESLAANSIVGLSNPARATVNALFLPLGYLAPMRQKMFHIINSVTHLASRGAAFEQAYLPFVENSAKVLLQAAESEGLNVGKLVGRNAVREGEQILAEGVFSPQEAGMILGERYGKEWARMLQQAREAGYANADKVLGNFGNRGPLEKTIDTFFPFMSWTWRAYPRVARMALSHPVVTAGLMQLWEADAKQAESEGRPAYQVPSLSINKDTPLVGLLAKVFSPEQEAEVRVNPLSFLMPFSGSNLEGFSEGADNETTYQKLKSIAGAIGGSPSPILGAAAYIHGDDYQSPSPGSRYASLDQLGDESGFNVELPSLAHGSLRAARKAMSGKTDTYDPVKSKAQELIFEQTGLPAADRRNIALAVQLEDPESPLMQEAERVLDTSGSIRAGFNAMSPASAMVNTQTAQDKRRENLGMPFDPNQIYAMKDTNPAISQMMQRVNDQYMQQHPVTAVGKKPNISPRDLVLARGAEKRRLLQQLYGIT